MTDAEFQRGKELWRRFRQKYLELKEIAFEIQGKQGRVRRGRRKKKTMPIYEAASSLILHFGHGDIAVCNGRNVEKDYEDEIVFVRQEPHEIGASGDELIGKATEAIDCPVRFIFDKVESLDVVMDELGKLRKKMVARNNQMPS
jgi:hypothetical protein